jgi:hypothetical protein
MEWKLNDKHSQLLKQENNSTGQKPFLTGNSRQIYFDKYFIFIILSLLPSMLSKPHQP